VLTDPAAAGDPSRFSSAWEWRQLDTWLTSIRAAGDPAALQRKLETLGVLRRRTVAELVAQRAWRRLADNLGDRQRQALNSYMQAMKRYGKTGGKFAARWLAEIRQALDESKDAVPVWIMTTGRALTSFRPAATPPFDVLVIDEASQIGIDAIPLFSLARTAIVVGDDKQTSPENVGLDRQAVFDLLDEHLMAVPKYRTLFDADNSLYDLAFQKFPDVVMLTEHFRSLPPIIQFSNVHAYDGRIVPLRDQAPHLGWQAVGSIRVEDGYRKGDANEPEADVVVDLIEKLIADPNYDGMDFGVVSILGSTQSKLIWDRLYERIGPKVMRERNLRCGEAANFQGDERDVMVISTVVAVNPGNPSARIGAMTGRAAERRINVAASRARNQMWVVHSVEPDSFPNGDLRADLIRHCQSPQLLDADLENLLERCDSDFERHVVTRILARGYRRVRVQHPVGRFRIDIVVEGAQSRLAVECDGDRWHGEDAWHRDRMRQEVLERAGWTFERIRGSSFYRDPDNALEPLWQRLDELGIFTGDMQPEEIAPPIAATTVSTPRGEELVDRADDVVVAAGAPKSRAPEVDTEFAEEWTASRPERLEPEDDFRLDEYVEWKPNSVPAEPSTARPAEIVDSLADIVRQEGPIKALRAYQLYVKAAGGQRVGREIRRRLNQAASQAVRLGRISCIADDETEQIEKTYFSPDGPAIAVRELGSRRLDEVPESEIQSLIQKLGGARVPDIKRRVLDAYGLTRLTAGADAYLDACIRYEWKQPGS
jgi:very-short-patch-repair endonuclease